MSGRRFRVAYTPGHAVHHVSFFEETSGLAFVGDAAGMAVGGGYVLAPTPPPDVDLEAWRLSVERVEAWGPDALFLTHFGAVGEPRAHLRQLVDNLEHAAALVKRLLGEDVSEDARIARFADELRRELRRRMPEGMVGQYESAAPWSLLWRGLSRYWRKRGR